MDKVILVAYDLNPELGSECGIAHIYLRMYLKHYNVLVYTNKAHKADIEKFKYGDNVIFRFIDFSLYERLFAKFKLDIISNWTFCRKTGNHLLANEDISHYKFIHIVTPEGFFAFNDLYRLGLKYVIGPINGGLKSPKNFKRIFLSNLVFDFFRDTAYNMIVKLGRWNKYYDKADSIIISDQNLLYAIPEKYHKKTFQIFDVLVDPAEFIPDNTRTKSNDKFRILFTGRLIPKKGVQLLLEGYKKCLIKYEHQDIVLDIVGKGPLRNYILSFIENNNLQRKVSLFSNLPKNILIEKYQTADIYCLPTLREPGGLAILEAMSCALPIITSNYGGPSFSVTSDCGIKLDMNGYDQYINSMAEAFHLLYSDTTLRKRMGLNARERIISEFSIESVENKLMVLWGKLLTN